MHQGQTNQVANEAAVQSSERTGDRKTGTKTVRMDTAIFLKTFFWNKTKSGKDKNWVSSVFNNNQQETKVRR
jgi:hypothetical protein